MRKLDKWQQFRPIITSQVAVHSEHVVDGTVDTLKDRIALRTIRGGTGFLVPKDRLQFFHKPVFKFLALIRVQSFRRTKHRKDAVYEVTHYYCGFFRFDGDQYDEAREMVDDRQDVAVSFGQ